MAKLGELGKIITGKTPKTSDAQNYESNDICFVKPSDFADNEITEIHQSEFYISEYAKDKARVLPTDSILVTCIGIIGKVAINKVPCAFNQQINAIVPEKKVCDPRYVAYAIQNMQPQMQSAANAAVVPILNKTQFLNIEVPLLPIGEQKRIACNLNKIDKLISLRKQQLAKLDELVKARFVEMFGDLTASQCEYPELKLVDVCADADDIKCGPFGTQLNKDEYKTKGVAVWEIPQINSGFSEMPTHFITEEKAVILNAYSIEPGDIAMSRKGNVGKCGLFPENFKKGIIHSDVLRIRVDKRKVDSCFMMYQLHFSEAVKRQIEMVSSGAIMAGINVTKLKQIKVRIPELENQRMFAAFVQRVDQQKQVMQQSLEKLELMKKALMQEYFG